MGWGLWGSLPETGGVSGVLVVPEYVRGVFWGSLVDYGDGWWGSLAECVCWGGVPSIWGYWGGSLSLFGGLMCVWSGLCVLRGPQVNRWVLGRRGCLWFFWGCV